MAGIGFVLKRVVTEENYSSVFKGYLAAVVIFAGPWFLSVLTMALMSVASSTFLPPEEKTLFFSAVVYSFAFSMVTMGLVQMPATRMLADMVFINKDKLDQATPALTGLMLVVLPIQMVTMTLIFAVSGVGLEYALSVGTIYAAVSGIWFTMFLLSAAERYTPIVWAFVFGYAVSFACTFAFGHLWGPTGAVAGFGLGQSVTFIVLWLCALREFGPSMSVNFTVFRYCLKFPSLVAVGFLYNLGIWIDKMMFWFSGEALQVKGLVSLFLMYDTVTLLAFLTAAPAMVLFLIQVETQFYGRWREFFDKVVNRATRREITADKHSMAETLVSSYTKLLRLQLLVGLLSVAFAPMILEMLGLPEAYLFALRLSILGVGLHVFLTITVLMLLYFDMRGSAVLVLLAFVLTNIAATAWTIVLGYQWFGFGFLTAEAVATVVAIGALVNRFRNLEYLIFIRQPITKSERALSKPIV